VFASGGCCCSQVLDSTTLLHSATNEERHTHGIHISKRTLCMQLRVQPKGFGASWMLDRLEVTDTRTGQTVRFLYRDWFANKQGWRHTLFPVGSDGSRAGLNTYLIRVHTSDVRGAGVSAATNLLLMELPRSEIFQVASCKTSACDVVHNIGCTPDLFLRCTCT
jgi:hypothetical protein